MVSLESRRYLSGGELLRADFTRYNPTYITSEKSGLFTSYFKILTMACLTFMTTLILLKHRIDTIVDCGRRNEPVTEVGLQATKRLGVRVLRAAFIEFPAPEPY